MLAFEGLIAKLSTVLMVFKVQMGYLYLGALARLTLLPVVSFKYPPVGRTCSLLNITSLKIPIANMNATFHIVMHVTEDLLVHW